MSRQQSVSESLDALDAHLQQSARDGDVVVQALQIPAVCFIEDVCRVLRVSRTTVEKLRRHGAFPIPELSSLDKRPRWSGHSVATFLTNVEHGASVRRLRRAR